MSQGMSGKYDFCGFTSPTVAQIAASRANPEAEKSTSKAAKRVKFDNPSDSNTTVNAAAAAEICAAKFMAALSLNEKKG